jgi:acetylornithine deacetylase/succinyl-diaminopimelate desuccinylase-like protein
VPSKTRKAEVLSWIDERADEMAALVTRLIAVDTENPPGRGLRQAAGVLHEALGELGLRPDVLPVPPSGTLTDSCVVRASAGEGAKLVYFHGHFDVVPAQRRDQFTAIRRDGRIVGRGAADMKGGLASMIYGAAAASDLGLLGDGRIVLHLVCDEETGSVVGSGFLRQAGLIDPTALAMLTAEPSSSSIWHAARGAITLRVTVQGTEAHVGHADRGKNAFQQMVQIAQQLLGYAEQMRARPTALPMDPDDGRGSMIVVGGMSGSGANFNVVPGKAWFSVDSRFNPEENLEAELATMRRIIHEAAGAVGANVAVELVQFQPSASTDEAHPAGVTLARCVTEARGAPARFEMCAGVLDVRWYAQLGIPAFGFGAGRLDVSHGPDEYIDEAEMRRCAAVYALYAAEMLA